MAKVKKEKRFESIREENVGGLTAATIIRDKETGVEYLFISQGYSGGLTPLLDSTGKPIIKSNIEN